MTHYFENDPHLKSHEIKRKVIIHNHSFSFYTDDGVFSKRGLDFGTRTLLENLELSKIQGDVLDFGCGYGPIAIFLAKETSASIDAVDINKRSIALAKKNAILNQVVIDVWESDIYSNVSKKYDFIITNPPIRVGKKILYQILFGAKKHLKEKGELWLVIHKDQGAKTVVKELEKQYYVNIICKNKGFFIIQAINN